MKSLIIFMQLTLLSSLLFGPSVFANNNDKVMTHVTIIWLNQAGDEAARNQFLKVSQTLNDLPGLIHRHVAAVEKSDRSVVNDTFDILITATFKNKAALDAYLEHPKHKKAVVLFKTMVNRIVMYNTIDQ
jgi:hypothetical protein